MQGLANERGRGRQDGARVTDARGPQETSEIKSVHGLQSVGAFFFFHFVFVDTILDNGRHGPTPEGRGTHFAVILIVDPFLVHWRVVGVILQAPQDVQSGALVRPLPRRYLRQGWHGK